LRNEHDLQARQVYRQARPAGSGSRLQAGSGGVAPQSGPTTTSTRVDAGGRVRRLWLFDFDPFDAPGFYFGTDALPTG
jgi:hypothetical protein